MIAAGVNAKALATFMGHANIAITYDLYAHLMPGSESEAAGRLEAFPARSAGAPAGSAREGDALPKSVPTDQGTPWSAR